MDHPNNIPPFDESLIVRHFNNECSPEEDVALLSWIDASNDHLETYLKMKQLWALRRVDYYASDTELRRALGKTNEKIRRIEQRRRRATFVRIGRYAAVFVLLLGGFLIYRFGIRQETPEKLITVAVADNEAVRIVMLPDSSKVWLNENTSLSYPEAFTQRSVSISGEAFFEVKHDSERPFTVDAGALHVRVLGTSFNIKARPAEGMIQTTLTAGKVALYDRDALLASLLPGQQAAFDCYNRHLDVRAVNIDLYTSWRTGLIMFDRAYLSDILKSMEEAYNVRIAYNSHQTVKNRYNFVFRKNQPIETVLEMLQFVAPISYKKNNNDIYINEK